MGLKAGDEVYYRLIPEQTRYGGTVLSIDDEDIILQASVGSATDIPEGQYIVITGPEHEYYTKVVGIEGNTIRLKRMWTERRGFFRVDDAFPVIAQKAEKRPPCKKSKVIAGYGSGIYDSDLPDETISPLLWKMLSDINSKLGLILERLHLEGEGLLKAESRQVNVSASGIRFTVKEKVEIGDTLEVKMLLPTCPPVGIITYGNVVRVNDIGNGEYEVALHFSDMDDEVRDEIIQYTLKRQREIIRRQRQQKEEGDDAQGKRE